jgi:hypothetical protein
MAPDDDLDPAEDLPPELPETLAELDEARLLLGQRGRGDELGPKPRAKLVSLIGAYPSPALALRWKRSLRDYREELQGELGD